MFIERATSKNIPRSSGAKRTPDFRIMPETLRSGWSASFIHNRFSINIRLRWSQEHYQVLA
jgi:hypothetical protein